MGVIRDLSGGWWGGVPSHLKPAPERDIGREVAGLAGDVPALVARARRLASQGDLGLASHLIDWAVAADPEHRGRTARAPRSTARGPGKRGPS
jgi:alkyl sulfatase BDS1-like metallo-beta-lactamase superfamily hydrolase